VLSSFNVWFRGQDAASEARYCRSTNVVGNRAGQFGLMEKIIKRLTSYFKKDWDIDDYPVELYRNENPGEDNVKFGALITDWSGMVGHGETKEKAFESLKEHFKMFKDNNELPRPGTKVPIKYALTQEIERHEEIAVDFFDKILKLNYYDCFVSDESSLGNFDSLEGDDNPDDFKDKIIKRVHDTYGIDISDVYDSNLVDVFEKIKRTE
jgi:predicted RNase H-like HicB family nuclease